MTITPTITIQSTPGLQVSGAGGITYAQILNELGYSVFWVSNLYYYSSSLLQFGNPLQYLIYDSNGNQKQNIDVTLVSVNQFLPVMIVKMDGDRPLLINGSSKLSFNINPGVSIQFLFYNKRIRNTNPLDAWLPDNFKKLQAAMDIPDFFEDYNDRLP